MQLEGRQRYPEVCYLKEEGGGKEEREEEKEKENPLFLNINRISLFGFTECNKHFRVTTLKSCMCVYIVLVHKHKKLMINKEMIKNY